MEYALKRTETGVAPKPIHYSPDAEALRRFHSLWLPNHHLREIKKALLLKYSNGDFLTEYDVYLINALIRTGEKE